MTFSVVKLTCCLGSFFVNFVAHRWFHKCSAPNYWISRPCWLPLISIFCEFLSILLNAFNLISVCASLFNTSGAILDVEYLVSLFHLQKLEKLKVHLIVTPNKWYWPTCAGCHTYVTLGKRTRAGCPTSAMLDCQKWVNLWWVNGMVQCHLRLYPLVTSQNIMAL